MRNYLKQKRSGYATAEWVISSPYLLLLMALLGIIVAFMISTINFSSMASFIASDMNLRQTGFKSVQYLQTQENNGLKATVTGPNNQIVYSLSAKDNLTISSDQNATGKQNIKNALIRSINENREMLAFPFTRVTNIDCNVTRPTGTTSSLNTSGSANDFSSSLVKVNITYGFSTIKVFNHDLLPPLSYTCTGYAVIT